ncbi:hypothetical protein ACWEPN_07155 [Nonomuraea wenchangensis]
MVTSYRRLLSHSGVPYLLAVALTVKLSTPVLGLALLLAALDRLGSYTAAGFVLTAAVGLHAGRARGRPRPSPYDSPYDGRFDAT